MPLYDYRCKACGAVTEVRHGFDERFDGVCSKCGGELVRVFNPAPIVFKGSGFYVTDSRAKSGEGKKSESSGDAPKSDAKPAEKPSEKKKPSNSDSAA